MSASASRRSAKAGISGLVPCFVLFALLVCPIGIAAAEPLVIEIAKAEAIVDKRTKEPILSLTLKDASKQMFAEFTQNNVGRKAVLLLNGRVLAAPVIREPILQGSIQITGQFSAKETKEIADRISSGGKVEVELVQ